MTRNASKTSLEKPLLGAVLCCTSITPEDRTRLAEYAEQMGAEHKLDLTSDVTHLLVGSTDTPKYQYVAREREDVKVLRPEWVEAVRECWMEDKPLDMNALEAEYRVSTLAGLRICITGFDDLSFRAQLQRNVIANGGEYTGDLTKEVTHLIAAKPEGKKYEYAMLWQKKVVSLQWYKDTLDRGMQLDEKTYHPTRPAAEQGVGAWNRQEQRQLVTGKRARDDQAAQEPVRKLRRTASAKLGSQTDDMWGDITRQTSEQDPSDKAILRSSKSMPAIREEKQTPENQQIREQKNDSISSRDAYLQGLYFVIVNFEQRKETIINRTLQGAGAEVVNSVTDLINRDGSHADNSFLIMPHQTQKAEVPQFQNSTTKPTIVTELWLERCILHKSFIKLSQYPLGGLITKISAPDIEKFTINATGFQSIETLHIAKTIAMTGAKYIETFTAKVSVLVCNSINLNNQKLFHAKEWGVPVVSESWLCAFLVFGLVPDFSPYSIEADSKEDDDLEAELKQKRQERHSKQNLNVSKEEQDDSSKQSMTVHPQSAETSFYTSEQLVGKIDRQAEEEDRQQQYHAERQKNEEFPVENTALREVSPNSPSRRNRQTNASAKKPLFRTYDGAGNTPENRDVRPEQDIQPLEESAKAIQSKRFGQDTASINSAIQDLLNMKSKAKANAAAQQSEPASKKKRLLGRALSNLSNASHNSRQSRASSVDSLNTDGVGSEIAPPSGKSKLSEGIISGQNTSTVQGRIQSKPSPVVVNGSLVQTSIDLSDPNLLRDDYADEEEAPQMTQLGYEDSEEAIALREKLAEKRRARSKLDQGKNDPQPGVGGKERETPKQKQRQKQVIKDDDLLEAAGWGGGRRTRAKNRSTDLTDLDMF